MRVTIINRMAHDIMLPRPFSTNLPRAGSRSWVGIRMDELEKAEGLQGLIDGNHITLTTGDDDSRADAIEGATLSAAVHKLEHEFFMNIPAAGVGLFAATAGATGNDNAPVAVPAYPRTAQFVVGAGFDGDGTIILHGVRQDGIVDAEIIPLALADAGNTVQGIIPWTRVTEIIWNFGTVWTVGIVTVQTGTMLGLKRRNIANVIKTCEDQAVPGTFVDNAAYLLGNATGTFVFTGFAFSGAESFHIWYECATADFVDTDQ